MDVKIMKKMAHGFYMVFFAVLFSVSTYQAVADTATIDKIKWTYTVSNGEALLTDYGAVPITTSGAITIPSTLGGYPVTCIGPYAFCDCNRLTSVTIPNSVTNVVGSAFKNCSGLKRITVDSDNPKYKSGNGLLLSRDGKILVIGVNGDVIIPEGVETIGDDAFYYIGGGLTSVTMPDSVTNIGSRAFCNCAGLKNVLLPDGVMNIGSSAFSRCCGLSNLLVPNGVMNIENQAFYYCEGLTNVVIGNSVTNIGSHAFHGCSGLTNVTIPNSVTNVESAFGDCANLTSVTIGAGVVTRIGCNYDPFWHCDRLTNIVVASGNPKYKSSNGLLLSRDGKTLVLGVNGDVVIPDGVKDIGEYAFDGRGGLTSVVISDTVTNIGSYAFHTCRELSSVIIGDGVTSIGERAFGDCSKLTSFCVGDGNSKYKSSCGLLLSKDGKALVQGVNGDVAIPDGVTDIEDLAFYECSGLTSVTMPDSLIRIGRGVFVYCYNLKEVKIGNSVTSIGNQAFLDCPLENIVIPSSVTNIGQHAFYGCGGRVLSPRSGGKKLCVHVPQYVCSMIHDPSDSLYFQKASYYSKGYVFIEDIFNCDSITDIVVAPGVTNINDGVFEFFRGLTSVTISEGVVNIGDYAFNDCYNLVNVSLPNSVTNIGEGAFNNCEKLSSVTIPEGIAHIEAYTFYGCNNLMSVTIPNSVMDIGEYAFSVCSKLTNVTIGSGVERIKSYAFHCCGSLKNIVFAGDAPICEWGTSFSCVSPNCVVKVQRDSTGWGVSIPGNWYGMRIEYYTGASLPKPCRIIFNAMCYEMADSDRIVQSGSAVGVLPELERARYNFLGWFTSQSGGTKINATTKVVDNVIYYAHWQYVGDADDLTIIIETANVYVTDDDGGFSLALSELVGSTSFPKLTVKGLPTGLKYDAKTMTISGKATKPGMYKVTVSATNATVKKPVTAEFEIVVPNLASEKLPGLEQNTKAYGVVMCGVALPMGLVDCTPEDGWTVKVVGLPAGLKFTAKDIVDSKTKEVTVPANTIYGVPTKAGTFTVTFTATKKGEANQVATITLNVEALPDWAQGTFTGYVVGDDWSRGFATMTVAANGKVSGKIALEGTNWTFKAESFSRVEHVERVGGGDETRFIVEAEAKAGKVERPIELVVAACDGGFIETALPNAVAEGMFGDCEMKMWRGMWKDKATAAEAKAAIEKFMGVYTVSVADGADYGSGYLSLTVGKDGNAKATGKLADGTSVSATSPLMYDEDAGWFTMLYAAPSAYKGGAFAAAVGFEAQLTPVLFAPQWSSCNVQATGEYGEGFAHEVDMVGSYYNKLDTLRKYYESVRVGLGGALGDRALPELGYTFKETSFNELGKKATVSYASTASAVDTLGQSGLTATVNEKGAIVVEKATKPVQDKETKEWSYNGTNDGALTLSFTQATGIFKGSYTFWYDYESAFDYTTGKSTMAHTSKKVSFEGILVQGEEPKMDGFYLWDATGEYEDAKTGKAKTYKYKQSFPVRLVAE